MIAQSSREVTELGLLFAISKALSENIELRTALHAILGLMTDKMEMIRGTLTILNRKTGEIFIEEAMGLQPEEKAKGRYLLGEGITGQVVDTGEPVIVPRISDEPFFLDRTGSRSHLNKNDISFICVPIKLGNETIGALSVDRLFNESISFEEDVRLLTIIASVISQAVRLRQIAEEELEKLRDENRRLHNELHGKFKLDTIIGNSKPMRALVPLIHQVASTNSTVLVLGESGVGKERVAHAIHYTSNRTDQPFLKLNCAAIPWTLLESELFGHERGAFTGATSMRKGRFEQADNGTLFLDEIGEMPCPLQSKLLRILQEKEFERVGGSETIHVNVRIIAATNRNLIEEMKAGRFREDLYYRLNVFPIVVPPLRERKTDILLLAEHFIKKFNDEHGKDVRRISTPAIDMMMSYHWPGNVRELENCIERALILSTDHVIHSHHLPPSLQTALSSNTQVEGVLDVMVSSYEKELIIEALKDASGVMATAAKKLGITERIMGLRVAKYEIDFRKYRHTEKL